MTPLHLVGQRFNRLTVLSHLSQYVRCRCDCGNIKLVRTDKLKAGTTKSCGCLARDLREAAKKPPQPPAPPRAKMGADERRLRAVWSAMVQRCHNPRSPDYKHYGGRGITVCQRWRDSVDAFLADMAGAYRHGLWLERLDNREGYSPENCTFRTPFKQAINRSNTLAFPNGVALASWCRYRSHDYQAAYRVFSRLRAKLGRLPTQQEVEAELS